MSTQTKRYTTAPGSVAGIINRTPLLQQCTRCACIRIDGPRPLLNSGYKFHNCGVDPRKNTERLCPYCYRVAVKSCERCSRTAA